MTVNPDLEAAVFDSSRRDNRYSALVGVKILCLIVAITALRCEQQQVLVRKWSTVLAIYRMDDDVLGKDGNNAEDRY